MGKRKRSVAAALRTATAQANFVPTLNEMLKAKFMEPFPRVRVGGDEVQETYPRSESKHVWETYNFEKHEHDAEFVCTACGRSVAIVEVREHPVLHVGICKHCYDFQLSDPFTKDNPQDPFWHENECRWCGDGGDVILCDSCPKVFCKYCIKRNFGEEILSAIEWPPRKWSCFVCIEDHLQLMVRDYMQMTLIYDLLQSLICEYNNVENLVKTINRSGQPRKSRTSRFDEENNNHQSSLHAPSHHQDEHKKACSNDSSEDKATPLQHANHLEHHLGFRKKLTPSNIGRSNRELGSDSEHFVFPMKDFTRGTKFDQAIPSQNGRTLRMDKRRGGFA